MKFKPTKNNVVHLNTKMKRRRRLCGNVCLLLVGVVLVSLGLYIFLWFEPLYDLILTQALRISPTSEAFKVWRINDPPLDMDIYLFNWTNPEEIRNLSVKPHFEEIGPYRFKEVKEKVNITWNDNNTISYRHRKSYYFDPENSVRNLSDMITTVNAVPLTIAFKARNLNGFSKFLISRGFSTLGSTIHVTRTAGEILFDGYEDHILGILSYLPIPDVKEKFGIFYGKNGTIGGDGAFEMSTASGRDFGKLLSWNYKNETEYYQRECNAIKGSAGEFYPLNRKRDHIQFYSSELCKFATLEYEEDVNIQGVQGYKFTAKHIFDNGTTRPENSCFCVGECIPSGVLNVSSCRQNSPSFLSMPHFYNADPYYTDRISGLKPEPKHEFFITMEPKSGVLMDINAKMQLNFLLQPDDRISLYSDIPKIFVPIFYFDQNVKMKPDLAMNLRMIQNLPEYSNYLSLILLSLGTISLLWSVCSMFYCRRYKLQANTQMNEVEIPLQNRIKNADL